jgi:iron complex outermembrane receptor protein
MKPLMKGLLPALLTLALQPALAQTPPAPTEKKEAEEQQKLEAVTVTANRRLESAQKVSAVVQSVGGDQLRKDGIFDLRQLQQAIPGLSIANQEGNVEIYIRGVGSSNNTELGDPGAAPHIDGVYIPRPRGLGGLFFDLERVEVNKGPQGTLYGRNAMAGTLNIITAKPRLGEFSGFAQAGVSKRSGREAEAALNVPLGDSMAVRVAGMKSEKDYGFQNATRQAIDSGSFSNPDSHAQRAATLKPAGLEDNWAARVSWRWDLGNAIRLSAMADTARESGTGYPGANVHQAVTTTGQRAETLDLRKVVYRGTEGDMRNQLDGLQLRADVDLGEVALEAVLSRRQVDFYQRNAASESVHWDGRDYSAIQYDNFSSVYWASKSDSTVAELRLVSTDPTASLQWAAGLFHFKEDQQVGFLSVADRGYCCYSGTEFTMPDTKAKASAAFVDGTLKLSPEWRLFAGGRVTHEEKSRFGIGGNLALTLGAADFGCCVATRFGTEGFVPALLNRPNFDLGQVLTKQQIAQFLLQSIGTPGARDTMIQQIGGIANGTAPDGNCFLRPDINNGWVSACPPGGGFSYANLGIPEQQRGSSKARFNDFRIGLEHDLARDRMVYAKLGSGHKAGGFNDSFQAVSAIPEEFAPEKLTVLEIGSRNAFDVGGRRAVLNASAFAYRYDTQVFQDLTCINFNVTQNRCDGYSLVNRNIGDSSLHGLELEARLGLPAGFNIDANLVWLRTKIKSGEVADVRAQDFDLGGQTPLISLVGNELPLASRLNLSLRLQQQLALGNGRFDWQILANYRSGYYLSQFNEDEVVYLDNSRRSALAAGFPDRQPGFTTLNLGLGYSQGALRLEAWASNLTNEQASQKAIIGANVNVRFLNDARSYGVRGRYSF